MLIFFHMVKTAGTTINYIFRNNFGINYVDVYSVIKKKDILRRNIVTKDDLEYFLKRNNRIRCISGHAVRPFCDFEGLSTRQKYITFLREPVSRYISHYNHHLVNRKDGLSFEDWLSDPKEKNYQVKFIANEDNLSKAKEYLTAKLNFVGLVENFNLSLVLMKQLLPLPLDFEIRYKKINAARRYNTKENLSSAIIKKIIKNNELDISLYNFAKNELFEKQKIQYEGNLKSDLISFERSLTNFRFNFFQLMKYGFGKYFLYRNIHK